MGYSFYVSMFFVLNMTKGNTIASVATTSTSFAFVVPGICMEQGLKMLFEQALQQVSDMKEMIRAGERPLATRNDALLNEGDEGEAAEVSEPGKRRRIVSSILELTD